VFSNDPDDRSHGTQAAERKRRGQRVLHKGRHLARRVFSRLRWGPKELIWHRPASMEPSLDTVTGGAANSPWTGAAAGVGEVPVRLPDRIGGPRIPSVRSFRVLFVIRPGVWDAVCMRYRGYNVMEALRLAGVEVAHLDDRYLSDHLARALAYDLIVLVRRQMTPEIAQLLDAAGRFSVPVIFELDDYLFDDETIPYVEMYRNLPIHEARAHVRKWRDLLDRCDYCTASTAHLAERAAATGKDSYLIHNGVNVTLIELSRRALEDARRAPARRGLRLGYVSGTRTHQKDFRQIAPVLLRLMDEFPTLELIVRGDFDLAEFPEFVRFGARVVGRPFIDWRQVPEEIAQLDINLIPLEINTFTEAKSELKYLEAALLKVPSVATPTRPFASCITHGVNGFVARDADEWYDALRSLIIDPELRSRMGERAYRHAIAAFGPNVIADEALTAYRKMLAHHRRKLGVGEGAATVVVLLSDLDRALRDHDPAIVLSFELVRAGASVSVHITDGPAGLTAADAWQSITDHIAEPPFAVQVDAEVPCCDILLATDPATAHIAKRSEHRAGWVAYLVAGYRPAGLPPGDEKGWAVQSYELGLDLLALDPDVADRLSRHHRARVHLLPAWVERPVASAACDDRRKVLIAATGHVPGRAWIEVLAALDRVHAERPDVEITVCGNTPADGASAGFPHRELAGTYGPEFEGLLAERPVCVVLHDSGPPRWLYDLMAAGCPVIAVGPHAAGHHSAPERDAGFVSVDADARMLANTIDSLLIDPVRLGRLVFLAADRARDLPGPCVAAGELLRASASAAAPSRAATHTPENNHEDPR
jgi:glycosyltransferase involved in cell wall biosynthesis